MTRVNGTDYCGRNTSSGRPCKRSAGWGTGSDSGPCKDHGATWLNAIPEIAANHNKVAGVLAGFSATIFVLLKTPRLAFNVSEIEASLNAKGIFAIAFFGYVATGVLYSVTVERESQHRSYIFSMASIVYYFSGLMAFAGLYASVVGTGDLQLRWGVAAVVLFSLVGAFLAASIPLMDLFRFSFGQIAGLGIISAVTGVTAYWLVTGVIEVGAQAMSQGMFLLLACVIGGLFLVVILTFPLPRWANPAYFRWSLAMGMALATAVVALLTTSVLIPPTHSCDESSQVSIEIPPSCD